MAQWMIGDDIFDLDSPMTSLFHVYDCFDLLMAVYKDLQGSKLSHLSLVSCRYSASPCLAQVKQVLARNTDEL